MSIKPPTLRGTVSRRARLMVTAVAALGLGALAVPSAIAQPAPVATAATLAATSGAVADSAPAGSAWYTDPASGKVVMTVDSTVSATELKQVTSSVPNASQLVVKHVSGTFRNYAAGGDAINTGAGRCSLGFNVRSGSTYYALTAGHCTNIGTTWTSGGVTLGTTAGSSFPGNDYGIIRLASSSLADGRVNLYNGSYRDITAAGTASVGQSVTRSGSTSGVHSGTVQATNTTVRYSEGTVSGLIQTNVCAEPGDSGGPLFSGTTALGLTSGGSGNCTSGGTTFFQPVTEPLGVYGVSVF